VLAHTCEVRTVEISYSLATRRGGAALIRNPLMDLLHAVRDHGSISAAAKALGFSYRHVWGELKRWEGELGKPLIVWEKGQPALLSEFGDKLLWAERQAQARLAPQVEALHADLERAFAVAFDDAAHVLALFASHDDALPLLREHAAASARLHLDVRFCGSVDAIAALNEGRCVMAGFHAPRLPGGGEFARRAYQPLLKPGLHKLIGFAQRTQGLIVAAGNPLGLATLADIERRQARFVNRALGTGTRVLLDGLLARENLRAAGFPGYEHCETSHEAVAQAIASGAADAGLGIEAAARSRGLGFVPMVREDYYLVCLKSALEQAPVAALRELLRSPSWKEQLAALPGYEPAQCGEVLSLKAQLPWWDMPPKVVSKRRARLGIPGRARDDNQTAQVRKPTKPSSRSGNA
jgi:putative molybdopterin biosynthesis protein